MIRFLQFDDLGFPPLFWQTGSTACVQVKERVPRFRIDIGTQDPTAGAMASIKPLLLTKGVKGCRGRPENWLVHARVTVILQVFPPMLLPPSGPAIRDARKEFLLPLLLSRRAPGEDVVDFHFVERIPSEFVRCSKDFTYRPPKAVIHPGIAIIKVVLLHELCRSAVFGAQTHVRAGRCTTPNQVFDPSICPHSSYPMGQARPATTIIG